MIRTSPKGFFTADGESASVHQVTKELPTYAATNPAQRLLNFLRSSAFSLTSRNLEDLEAFSLGNIVDRSTRRHTTSETLDTAVLEVRNRCSPIGNDRHRITRGHKRSLAVDHVPIAITIARGTELDVVLLNNLDKAVGIGQVGVGMTSAKVGRGNAVLDGGFGKAELGEEQGFGVRSGNTMQTIEEDFKFFIRCEEGFDEVKVEDALEQDSIVCDRVEDGDFERSISGVANLVEVDL